MKTIQVEKGDFPSFVLPCSKSHFNRLLVLSALTEGFVRLEKAVAGTDAEDVCFMKEALRQVGMLISEENKILVIENSFPQCEVRDGKAKEVFVGEGATTLRFLLALLSHGHEKYRLRGKGRLLQRPLKPLLDCLESLGVRTFLTEDYVEIQGPFGRLPSEIMISSEQTSQFSSALTLALVHFPEITIRSATSTPSRPYLELSQILVAQVRQGQREFTVPVDMSSLSYPSALAILEHEVNFPELRNLDHSQADAQFFSIIKKMGADFKLDQKGLTVFKAKELKGLTLDCTDIPDLVPTLAFLCAYAEGSSVLMGLGHLRYKESDRIAELLTILRNFSVIHQYDEEKQCLRIEGPTPTLKKPIQFSSQDHRMVMIAFLFASHNQGGELADLNCVAKSYPFFA